MPEPGQEGVYALLQGKRMSIEPEGFSAVHARGGAEHRLRSGDLISKWQPLGIGALEGAQIAAGDDEEREALEPGNGNVDEQEESASAS